MAVQGTIYNEAIWAGPPGRPCAGTRTVDPQLRLFSGSLKGDWGLAVQAWVVDEDGFVSLPDSFVREKESRITAVELWW